MVALRITIPGNQNRQVDWFARFGITPFRLQVFDRPNLLEIGAVGGFMSGYSWEEKKLLQPAKPKNVLFAGPAVDINLAQSVSVHSEVHFGKDTNLQALAGLRVRF